MKSLWSKMRSGYCWHLLKFWGYFPNFRSFWHWTIQEFMYSGSNTQWSYCNIGFWNVSYFFYLWLFLVIYWFCRWKRFIKKWLRASIHPAILLSNMAKWTVSYSLCMLSNTKRFIVKISKLWTGVLSLEILMSYQLLSLFRSIYDEATYSSLFKWSVSVDFYIRLTFSQRLVIKCLNIWFWSPRGRRFIKRTPRES